MSRTFDGQVLKHDVGTFAHERDALAHGDAAISDCGVAGRKGKVPVCVRMLVPLEPVQLLLVACTQSGAELRSAARVPL